MAQGGYCEDSLPGKQLTGLAVVTEGFKLAEVDPDFCELCNQGREFSSPDVFSELKCQQISTVLSEGAELIDSTGKLPVPREIEVQNADLNKSRCLRIVWKNFTLAARSGYLIIVQDITRECLAARQLKARERILTVSEENYKSIFHGIQEALLIHDSETGEILDVNQSMKEMFGYHLDDVTGGTPDIFSFAEAPFDREHAVNLIRKAAGGAPQLFEWLARKKNGELFWVEVSLNRVIINRRERVLGVGRDINKRKETEKLYKTIFSLLPIPVAVSKGFDGGFVLANEAFYQFHGVTEEEVTGKSSLDLDLWIKPEQQKEFMKSIKVGGTLKGKEAFIRNAENEIRQVLFYAAPTMYQGEDYVIGTVVDITDQKRIEEELGRSRRLLESALECCPTGIIIAEAPDVRISFCNSAALGIRGGKREFLTDIPLELHPERWQVLNKEGIPVLPEELPLSKAVLQGKSSSGLEFQIVQENGDHRWVLTYAAPVKDGQGEVTAGVVVFLDITDRRQMEEMMIQSEKMLSVGELAAGMAHEINNPLAGILQIVQLIRLLTEDEEKIKNSLDKSEIKYEELKCFLEESKINDYFSLIEESAVRASSIVRKMLDFSMKSGASLEKSGINSLIEEALLIASNDFKLEEKYDFRSISIVREFADDLPQILCYRIELEQVFLNILSNAAHALSDKEFPEGVGPEILIRTDKENDQIRIQVIDNGPGMSENVRRRILEPFFTTKKVGAGTGLGLSVSYFIVKQNHHGEMFVESSPGNGAMFTILLPIGGEHE